MPHTIPPGPYCPPCSPHYLDEPKIIGSRDNAADTVMARACEVQGIPAGVQVPELVWHLARTATWGNLNPEEKSRCWELARMVLAEASERMRAADGEYEALRLYRLDKFGEPMPRGEAIPEYVRADFAAEGVNVHMHYAERVNEAAETYSAKED